MLTGGVGASVAGSPSDVRAEVAKLLGVSADAVDPGGNLAGHVVAGIVGNEAVQ